MEWSSVKRLGNEMLQLENYNNRYIDSNNFYMIKIAFAEQVCDIIDPVVLAQEMLWSEPQPVSIYTSNYGIVLVFLCAMEDQKHQLNGNHNLLISKYSIKFYQIISDNTEKSANTLSEECINVKIVECSSQIEVITYIAWLMFSTSQRTMQLLSDGKITENLLSFQTNTELCNILAKECGIIWDKISSNEKYGSLLRINSRNTKTPYEELSGPFDTRKSQEFREFIFG